LGLAVSGGNNAPIATSELLTHQLPDASP
jgi:hypothetical protein